MPNKRNLKNLNVFCSTSSSRLNEINNLLIPSLEKQTYKGNITLSLLNYEANKKIKREDVKESKKLGINIVNPNKPLGFGEAHNYSFNFIKPEKYFLIINSDIYLERDCIKEMVNTFNNDVGLVEARQLPFQHPKDKPHKDTFETNWASGCCLLINVEFFKKVGGFDPLYWMYLEDVDLSWKAWINGYSVVQNPKAVAYHFTGAYFKYQNNAYELEHFWSIRNFLYISYVYFGENGLKKAKILIDKEPLTKSIKDEATSNFEQLVINNPVKHIKIPKRIQTRVMIEGFNKFSEFPK
jgi:GT2 family glycosyltransferase